MTQWLKNWYKNWCGKKLGQASSLTQTAPLRVPQPVHLQRGRAAEQGAVALLERSGLRVVQTNFKTVGRGGGEVDIIAWHGTTLVFVEVRLRSSRSQGGAAASIDWRKQKRIIRAAKEYLQRYPAHPPCRFDVIAVQPDAQQILQYEWLQGAFEAGA